LFQSAKRVLVVDDDAEILQLVRVLLRRIGLETILADGAASAAHILKTQPRPDLMILDLMMPGVSGVEFLRQMRSKAAFDDLPVLVLSALIESDDIRSALGAGADRYLTKPYIANNLVSIVQEMLKSGRSGKGVGAK
jgi:two-component system, OmpR family, phosphate regulon response regulator PhoB